eukprot:scaffold16869_cov84-Isochrysis_galbana.AAC.1
MPWWGAVGPTMAVGVCKAPHAPERGMGRPPRDTPLRLRCRCGSFSPRPCAFLAFLVTICACEVCAFP